MLNISAGCCAGVAVVSAMVRPPVSRCYIFRRRASLHLLEQSAEVLRIFKAEGVGHLAHLFACRQPALGHGHHKAVDVFAGRDAGLLLYQVGKIVAREA